MWDCTLQSVFITFLMKLWHSYGNSKYIHRICRYASVQEHRSSREESAWQLRRMASSAFGKVKLYSMLYHLQSPWIGRNLAIFAGRIDLNRERERMSLRSMLTCVGRGMKGRSWEGEIQRAKMGWTLLGALLLTSFAHFVFSLILSSKIVLTSSWTA